jgi:CheY-like chemotaxis protein
MTGHELAGRLRALVGTRLAHFIAVTGYGQASDQAMSRDAGFDHHLVKPVDVAQVQALLDRPLGDP